MKFTKEMAKHEDGQVLVMVAIMMVVLIGFAALIVDVSAMQLTKTNMQNAADAAAIAGAQKLPNVNLAVNTAKDYAEFNGAEKENTTVTTPYKDDPTLIEVVITKNIQHAFARIMGFNDGNVSARAVAKKVANLPSAFTGYAIFSESESTPLVVGKSGQSECYGAIHTNNALDLGKHLDATRVEANAGITEDGQNNIGERYPNYDLVTIPAEFKAELLAQVTSAPRTYIGDQTFAGNGLNLDQSVYVQGDVTVTGNNLIGKGFIYATGNINIIGNNTQIGTAAEPVFIYSEKNITISGNNPNMYCVIYAPNGVIDVQKNNWNLHGRLIGKEFADACLKNNFTITAGSGDFGGVPLGGGSSGLVE